MGSLKNVIQFGPAVLPDIADIYMSEELYYTDIYFFFDFGVVFYSQITSTRLNLQDLKS